MKIEGENCGCSCLGCALELFGLALVIYMLTHWDKVMGLVERIFN